MISQLKIKNVFELTADNRFIPIDDIFIPTDRMIECQLDLEVAKLASKDFPALISTT